MAGPCGQESQGSFRSFVQIAGELDLGMVKRASSERRRTGAAAVTAGDRDADQTTYWALLQSRTRPCGRKIWSKSAIELELAACRLRSPKAMPTTSAARVLMTVGDPNHLAGCASRSGTRSHRREYPSAAAVSAGVRLLAKSVVLVLPPGSASSLSCSACSS